MQLVSVLETFCYDTNMKRLFLVLASISVVVGYTGILYFTILKDSTLSICPLETNVNPYAGISCASHYIHTLNPIAWAFIGVLIVSFIYLTLTSGNVKLKPLKHWVTKKLPLVVSGIVFITTLVLNALTFTPNYSCLDTNGNASYLNSDAAIGYSQSCDSSMVMNDLMLVILIPVLLSLVWGIATWGIVWITSLKIKGFVKKVGLILLMLFLTVIAFIVSTFIASRFTGGSIIVDETGGQVIVVGCLVVSLIASLALILFLFKRKASSKSS